MARRATRATTQVESLRHKDKRRSIPTEELRDFVADDEQRPSTCASPASSKPLFLLCLAAANDRGALIALKIAQRLLKG
jgi:hypothetical protein